jgi:putative DNA primase/helicase
MAMTDDPVLSAADHIARNEDDDRQLTDTGLGTFFVDGAKRIIRYAIDTDQWFAWDGTRWEPDTKKRLRVFGLTQTALRVKRDEIAAWDDDNNARDRALRQLTTFESERKRQALINVAQADPRVQIKIEDLDNAPHEVVAPNGTIDLNTGNLRPSRPEDMNSRRLGVVYDPAAKSPLLDQFLETFLPEVEDQRFVFAVLGHALRVGNAQRTFPIFQGDTTSGKSQLFAALHKILDAYACAIGASVFRANNDDKPRPDLVNAMFTRVAYATEASKSWALHADQIKRLTGGDMLPYRDLYQGVVNKLPRFTPMLVTNVMPRITNADVPTKRRILVIRFEHSLAPGKEDPRIKQRFLTDESCLRAILARLVAGARDPVATDVTKIPKKYVLATMNARGDVDHTDEFLIWLADEGYLEDVKEDVPASACVLTSELHSLYSYWIRKHGDDIDRKDALSMRGLNAALTEKGWNSTRSAGTRWLLRRLAPNIPPWIRLAT